MGCTKCGSDTKMMELLLNKFITDALRDGTLQAGLQSCSGQRLQKDAGVLTCSEVEEAVCQLFQEGRLCINVPAILDYDPKTGKLKLVMSNGDELTTTVDKAPRIKSFEVDADGKLVLTETDDTQFKVTLPNATKKADGTVEFTKPDGTKVTFKEREYTAGQGLKLEGNQFKIKADPATLEVKSDGSLAVRPEPCKLLTNFNTLAPNAQKGQHCFFGSVTGTNNPDGFPVELFKSTSGGNETSAAGSANTPIPAGALPFDFEGFYVMTDNEVQVYVTNRDITYTRVSDANGITIGANGGISPTNWSQWRRIQEMPAMAPDTNFIRPNEVGNTIGKDASGKYNVKHDDTLQVLPDGRLSVAPTRCITPTNLDTGDGGLRKLGYTCFGGVGFVPGIPRSFNDQTSNVMAPAQNAGELDNTVPGAPDGVNWIGYQIITNHSILQYITNDVSNSSARGAKHVTWVRTHNTPPTRDGQAFQTNGWTYWRRETNIDVSGVIQQGGPTYTAGDGIEIAGNTLKAKVNTTQFSFDGGRLNFKLCDVIKALSKRDAKDGDYALGVGADGNCALIKIPKSNNPFDFTCKLPYKVEAESNVATKNGRIGLTYEFTNNYDNPVSFKFLLADASAGPFTLLDGPTKTSGGGTVRNLNSTQVNIQVDNLPAGQKIKFNVSVRPQQATQYNFGVHGLADTSGGNRSGLNTCGNGAGVRVLDGGQ